MVPRSDNFMRYLRTWFDDLQMPDAYVEACEKLPGWLADEADTTIAPFRDELAAHLRDSSFPPAEDETQWSSDEWLRRLWYDTFGPEAPPEDPFPLPARDWGHTTVTTYMIYAVGSGPEDSSPGAAAWLKRRGLTHDDVRAAKEAVRSGTAPWRAEPPEWQDHLDRLVADGRRPADETWELPDDPSVLLDGPSNPA